MVLKSNTPSLPAIVQDVVRIRKRVSLVNGNWNVSQTFSIEYVLSILRQEVFQDLLVTKSDLTPRE